MGIIIATLLFFLLFRVIMTKDGGLYHRILLIGFGLRLILLFITCTDFLEIPDAHGDADIERMRRYTYWEPFEAPFFSDPCF